MAITTAIRQGTVCRRCGAFDHERVVFRGAEERFGLGGQFSVLECTTCRFRWTDLPPDFPLGDWYERGYWRESDSGGINAEPSSPSRLRSLWRALNGSARPSRWITSGRVLDMGCGPGYDALEMRQLGADVIGLDTSVAALSRAAKSGLPTVCGDGTELPFADESFDAVVMSQVLEHLPDPEATLDEVRRILRPGGSLLVMLPNYRSFQRSLFGNNWVNWHLPYHLWHFDQQTLASLLQSEGFAIRRLRTVSPGEWALLSTRMRRRRETLKAPASKTLRFGLAPWLRLADLLGRGDCLVAEATRP